MMTHFKFIIFITSKLNVNLILCNSYQHISYYTLHKISISNCDEIPTAKSSLKVNEPPQEASTSSVYKFISPRLENRVEVRRISQKLFH